MSGRARPNHCYDGVVFAHNIWDDDEMRGRPTGRHRSGSGIPAKFDLHLKFGAAARRPRGQTNYPATDIDGQKRPLGNRVDAGADEVS